MRQGPPAILAAGHRGNVPAVEADQQDGSRDALAGWAKLCWAKLYLCMPMIDNERDRHFVAVAPGRIERALDLATVRADRLPFAIYNDLRRVDRGEPEKLGVA